MGYDGSSLWGGGLAEHHELDPLGDAVEKGDETLQDGVIHCAAVHHKAVVVLKLKREGRIGEKHSSIFMNPDDCILRHFAVYFDHDSYITSKGDKFDSFCK